MIISLSNPLGTDIIPVGFNYGLTRVNNATPTPLLLDIIIAEGFSTNDMYGFSFRKVYASYTGNCCRIRRDFDNQETDIGFDSNGLFDEASALAFINAVPTNRAFVVRMYDQYGSANCRAQPTLSDQPIIYEAGNFVRNGNNRVGCYFTTLFGGNPSWYQFDTSGNIWEFQHNHKNVWSAFRNERIGTACVQYSNGFYSGGDFAFVGFPNMSPSYSASVTYGNIYYTTYAIAGVPLVNLTGLMNQRSEVYNTWNAPSMGNPLYMNNVYFDINNNWSTDAFLFGGYPNSTFYFTGYYYEEIFCQHTFNPTLASLQTIQDNITTYFYP